MDPFTQFFVNNSVRIVVILILLVFGKAILDLFITRMKRIADNHNESGGSDLERRAETLGSVIRTTGNVVIYAVVLLMVLDLFKIDIRPILAGAGIVGLAVGFGAQSLVKDFVSGLFILVENQYSVGDMVKMGGIKGEVLQISIRSTVLKGEEKQIIYLSNGYISGKEVENLTQKGVEKRYE